MSLEIKGTVHHIGETQQVSEKFKKRELVIEYAENPTYPEYIQLEAQQDKCDKLDELRQGDTITVHFNLRGRPWTNKEGVTKYFNTLSVWKFDVNQTVAGNSTPEYAAPVDISSSDDDDLPF